MRLHQGRYDKVTVYHEDPVELARSWSGLVKRLHVVDLEGARTGRAMQTDLVRALVEAFGRGVQVGGGVRSLETLESYLELGVERVVLGSAVLDHPELVRSAARAHPGCVIIAVDARAGLVATHGWVEQSALPAGEVVANFAELPLAGVLYTDIERDGTEAGPNLEATARLARCSRLPVIASGGVGTLEHLVALRQIPGLAAVIVGRALHERRFTLKQALGTLGEQIEVC